MASILSYVPLVNRFVGTVQKPVARIDLPPVYVHDTETAPERRSRSLKHLLRANHANHAILFQKIGIHNHMPHILCSAYILGADATHLRRIYDYESEELEPWKESPEEVTEDDWRTFLGDLKFQRAYVDFFEDALAKRYFEWKKVVQEYLLSGKEPLVNCLISGLGHPLIHLGYAYEMNNRDIAMEALGMVASQYGFLHKYSDEPQYTRPSSFSSTSLLELLNKVSVDNRFDGISKTPGSFDIEALFESHGDLLVEYWNAWDLVDPLTQFRESQEAAVAVLIRTVPPGAHSYSFFLVHILTTSHAVRILLPELPHKHRIPLLRQWWLLTLAVYVAEMRPRIDPDCVPNDLMGRRWHHVEEMALKSDWALDSHYVKAIRAMKEIALTWGDAHDHHLRAALRFVDDFKGWTF